VTTVSTAIAALSRQIPMRWLEIAAAKTTPATIPITVLIPRSTRNSPAGPEIESLPVSTTPASVSARAAPVGSLNADSAITVCATFGFRRERMNRGIRMAGSVGARTAPTSSDRSHGRSNAKRAATPTTAAVSSIPGTASRPSVTQTRWRIGSESESPP
jgi:hypothetical protein